MHDPCAAACEGYVSVNWNLVVEVGAEKAVVLAFYFTPFELYLTYCATVVGLQGVEVCVMNCFAVEGSCYCCR